VLSNEGSTTDHLSPVWRETLPLNAIAIRNADDRGATSKPTDAGAAAAAVDASPEQAGVEVPTVLAQPGSLGPWLALARAR